MKYYLVVLFSVLMAAVAQMLLKRGANANYPSFWRQYLNPWVVSGYGILGLSLLVLIIPPFAPALVWVASTLNRILGRIASIPGASLGLHPSLLQIVMVYVIILAVYLIIFRRKGW